LNSAPLAAQGHAALAQFALAPGVLHLNHGSFGATPLSVLAEQQRWLRHMEANATRFFTFELPDLLRAEAAKVAARLGGDADGWVFVENATSATNGVLNSLRLNKGDVLVTTSHAYGAVLKAMRRRAEEAGADVRIAHLPAPLESEEHVVQAVKGALCERTKLLVIDHVTSPTATVFPVARLVAEAREAGVPVLVDGAHAPGMLALNIGALGADWYTGNAHKWLFAPKGCGVLWTAPEKRAETHPAITSHGWGAGYAAEFEWIGTRDPSAWLSFGAAARAHDELGGAKLMARNIALAREAGDMLSARLKAPRAAPASMQSSMTTVQLRANGTHDQALRLRRKFSDAGIEVPLSAFADALWLRISAQIYNESSDYERLADIAGRLLSDE
jgi:isopenicillin-N epimerase